ncbi:MAG: hypothetical protein S4CHLAM37_01500 [Chlamydiia bacterium]|nr:hypothetical protein [Chlamydiia bacterium]
MASTVSPTPSADSAYGTDTTSDPGSPVEMDPESIPHTEEALAEIREQHQNLSRGLKRSMLPHLREAGFSDHMMKCIFRQPAFKEMTTALRTLDVDVTPRAAIKQFLNAYLPPAKGAKTPAARTVKAFIEKFLAHCDPEISDIFTKGYSSSKCFEESRDILYQRILEKRAELLSFIGSQKPDRIEPYIGLFLLNYMLTNNKCGIELFEENQELLRVSIKQIQKETFDASKPLFVLFQSGLRGEDSFASFNLGRVEANIHLVEEMSQTHNVALRVVSSSREAFESLRKIKASKPETKVTDVAFVGHGGPTRFRFSDTCKGRDLNLSEFLEAGANIYLYACKTGAQPKQAHRSPYAEEVAKRHPTAHVYASPYNVASMSIQRTDATSPPKVTYRIQPGEHFKELRSCPASHFHHIPAEEQASAADTPPKKDVVDDPVQETRL